jgi:hypothetical protein
MSIPDNLKAAQGTWSGESRLHLHEEPIRTSPSQASVTLEAGGKFLAVSYDWVFEGARQEGLILLGLETETGPAAAVFIDSWHMGDKIMTCAGTPSGEIITVRGTYQVEGYPDWGWRIDVAFAATLRVVMYNVSPEGEEFLGFELIYAAR